MSKEYVLFSCVGNTDPIRGNRDGAMLHIVRYYKPKKVYLFFSKEMAQRKEEDYGYEWCIKQVSPKSEVERIVSDIKDPSDFSILLDEFPHYINEIRERHKDKVLLLNISSGTPQMKSFLALESLVRTEKGTVAIQVKSPEKASNDSRPVGSRNENEKYDFKKEYKNNRDNKEPKNRCIIPDFAYYRRILLKTQLKKLIQNYDYAGAFLLVQEENIKNNDIYTLLKHVQLRLKTKVNEAKELIESYKDTDLFPIKDERCLELTEYLMILEHKVKTKDFGDFVLRLEPFLVRLLSDYLKNILKFNVEQCLDSKGKILPEKIPGKLREKLFDGQPDKRYLSLRFLVSIFRQLKTGLQEGDYLFFKRMEEVKSCRNKIAHELTDITYEEFKKAYSMSPEGLLKQLWSLAKRIHKDKFRKEAQNMLGTINELLLLAVDEI